MEDPVEIPALPRQTMNDRQKAAEKRMQEIEAMRRRMRLIFDRVFSTADGKEALKFIHELSGHNHSPVRATQAGTTNPELSFTLQGRIDLYLDLRPFFPAKVVAEIEEFVHNESEKK